MCATMLLTSTNAFAKMIGYQPVKSQTHTYYFEGVTESIEADGKVYYTVSNVRETMSGEEYGYLKDCMCPGESVITVREPMEYFEVIYHEISAEADVSYRIFPDGSVVTGEENVKNIKPGTTYTLNWEGVYEFYRDGEMEVFVEIVSADDREIASIDNEQMVIDNPSNYIPVYEKSDYIPVYDENGEVAAAPEINIENGPAIAKPTDSEIVVEKGAWLMDAYNINGNNYFKLRDLAFAFTYEGSNRPFEVTWDGEKNAINLISNTQYTAVGGECGGWDVATESFPEPSWDEIINGKTVVRQQTEAVPTTSDIYIDGVKVNLTAYYINGNNYFKLRDLAQALDFEVVWNGEENRIYVSTYGSYIPE